MSIIISDSFESFKSACDRIDNKGQLVEIEKGLDHQIHDLVHNMETFEKKHHEDVKAIKSLASKKKDLETQCGGVFRRLVTPRQKVKEFNAKIHQCDDKIQELLKKKHEIDLQKSSTMDEIALLRAEDEFIRGRIDDFESQPTDSLIGAEQLLLESFKGRNIEPAVRKENALRMVQAMDRYAKSLYSDCKDRVKLNNTIRFFTTLDSSVRDLTPLERMVSPLEHLTKPTDGEAAGKFDEGIEEYMKNIAERAFDQHFENPEFLTTHGFDHTLNVTDYMKNAFELNPDVISRTSETYGITDGESRFVQESIALLHDIGYPFLEDRSKSVHCLSGADLVANMRDMFDNLVPGEDPSKRQFLNQGIRDAILFHAADKVEYTEMDAKIKTTTGTFIGKANEVVEILSIFDESDVGTKAERNITEIHVENEEMKGFIEEKIKVYNEDIKRKCGADAKISNPKVIVKGKKYKGRKLEFVKGQKAHLALKFTKVDLTKKQPLALIRVVDNMDMRDTRMTKTQRLPAFRDIYYSLGDTRYPLGELSQQMGCIKVKNPDDSPRSAADVQNDFKKLLNELSKHKDSNPIIEKMLSKIDEGKMSQVKCVNSRAKDSAYSIFKEALIDTLIAEYPELTEKERQDVRSIGIKQSDFDLRHFGGCESVKNITLEKTDSGDPILKIVVDEARFNELNQIKVVEKTADEEGFISSVEVGVGEYQIWRASEAYKSISLSEKPLELVVLNEKDERIIPAFLGGAGMRERKEEYNDD